MAGKWHLGNNARDRWRGFEKYYGCISGATRFFHPISPRDITPSGTSNCPIRKARQTRPYTTDAFTDYAIRFLKEEQAARSALPFFILPIPPHTGPCRPSRTTSPSTAENTRSVGTSSGSNASSGKSKSGLISPDWALSPRTPGIPDWDSLDEKKQDEMDLKMAVYAAMIDRVDQNRANFVATSRNRRLSMIR